MSDLVFLPAYQLAKKIQQREVSATEVLSAYLGQISQHNPTINAIVTLDEEKARQQAALADEALARGEIWGVLHGVPITAKDCYETAGMRSTCGYKGLSQYVPEKDATIIARMRSAGAIMLGKTNLAILASDMQTISDFGRTNNPWNTAYTAGGSSGGSASAIAAGFSGLDLCSGMGGSGRIPAHFCGVFAIKPTENRVSIAGGWLTPLEGDKGLQYMYSPGVMTRSVTDLKIWLSIVQGVDERSPHIPPAPQEVVPERSLKEYRIAWCDGFGNVPVTRDTRDCLEKLAQMLVEEGCQVEKAIPPNFDFTSAFQTCGELIGAWINSRPIPKRPTLSNDLRKLISGDPLVKSALRGTRLNLKQYAANRARQDFFTVQVDKFLSSYDAWIVPTVAMSAFPHHPVGKPFDIDGQQVSYLVAGASYTALFTLTGHPVVVLPVGVSERGLPIALQLVGRRWQDMLLLEIAEKISQVAGCCRVLQQL